MFRLPLESMLLQQSDHQPLYQVPCLHIHLHPFNSQQPFQRFKEYPSSSHFPLYSKDLKNVQQHILRPWNQLPALSHIPLIHCLYEYHCNYIIYCENCYIFHAQVKECFEAENTMCSLHPQKKYDSYLWENPRCLHSLDILCDIQFQNRKVFYLFRPYYFLSIYLSMQLNFRRKKMKWIKSYIHLLQLTLQPFPH